MKYTIELFLLILKLLQLTHVSRDRFFRQNFEGFSDVSVINNKIMKHDSREITTNFETILLNIVTTLKEA